VCCDKREIRPNKLVMTMSQEEESLSNPMLQEGFGRPHCAAFDERIEATRCLRSVLARKGISTTELVQRLAAIGVDETLMGLQAKVRRGGFSFGFFLLCMKAIGSEVAVHDSDRRVL
jgi:hypothetical protein